MKITKMTIFLIIVLILIVAGLIYYFGFYQKKNMEEENKITSQTAEERLKMNYPVPRDGISPLKQVLSAAIPAAKIEILEKGSGEAAKNGDTIIVHYTGILEDGTKFDSSLDRGLPFSFVLGAGQVIAGWEQGILGMRIGEKRKLTIAPELAYGEAGAGSVIPPKATLTFEVKLLEIK